MTVNNLKILLIAALAVLPQSCDSESNPTSPGNIQHLSRKEAMVIANCLTVQAAAEEFAFQNCKVYPGESADCTPFGNTLYDLLPGGELLENPVISLWVPQWGSSGMPGETSIEGKFSYGFCVGYEISGIGEESGVIIATLTNIQSNAEARILSQCYVFEMEVLVDFMRDNDGAFPQDIDTDINLKGKKVMDYYGSLWGYFMTNVFTGDLSEPRNGTASEPGSIAYSPVIEEDHVVGCVITAAGEQPGELIVNRQGFTYVHLGCHYLEQALLTFAWRNNMIFPEDLNTDTDLTGRTPAEYYPNASGAFYNQYTDVHSDPVMGTAEAAGEIAYSPVSVNGTNTGYMITGVGKYSGHVIVRHEYDLSEKDKLVYCTGAALRTAAERFAERNNGVYALDFDKDENLDSRTILDLLMSRDLLGGHATLSRTDIVNGKAAYPGETGYSGWRTGYNITSINEAGYYIVDYHRRTTQ